MKLEAVVIPVPDVDWARAFYGSFASLSDLLQESNERLPGR